MDISFEIPIIGMKIEDINHGICRRQFQSYHISFLRNTIIDISVLQSDEESTIFAGKSSE